MIDVFVFFYQKEIQIVRICDLILKEQTIIWYNNILNLNLNTYSV